MNNMIFMPQGTFLLCQSGAFFAGCLAMFAALVIWSARKNKQQQPVLQHPYTQPGLSLSPEAVQHMYLKQIYDRQMNAMLAKYQRKSDPDIDMLDDDVAQRAIDDLEAEIEKWKKMGDTDL